MKVPGTPLSSLERLLPFVSFSSLVIAALLFSILSQPFHKSKKLVAHLDYSTERQVSHAGPEIFALQLRKVWQNVGRVCVQGARIVVRFGAINDRKIEPLQLLKHSLDDSGWDITTVSSAGSASRGRRQALHFSSSTQGAIEKYDVWGIHSTAI